VQPRAPGRRLLPHPIAALFPDFPAADFAALVEDIRVHGVKVPIVVHGGLILDGRHRYLACCKLGIRCPAIEWDGHDPWFEVQSRNLLRRHLAKDQIYAIQKLAAEQFPELASSFEAAKIDAKRRKAQAKGQPRGLKALLRSADRKRESADVIGQQVGVSGSTVKRVDRLARIAPELLRQVAAGELSVARALQQALHSDDSSGQAPKHYSPSFVLEPAIHSLRELITNEWTKWPVDHRQRFVEAVRGVLQELDGSAHSEDSASDSDDSDPPGAAWAPLLHLRRAKAHDAKPA